MQDGRILGGRGHLHDGGDKMAILLNGKFLCDSKAEYGYKVDNGDMAGGHGHGDGKSGSGEFNIKTISKMSDCRGPFPVKKGDSMQLIAEYDLKQHPL
jgi:hypothetical protein